MEIYKEPYLQDYLRWSLAILSKQQVEKSYKDHPEWKIFLKLLKDAHCYAVAIGLGVCLGKVSKSYFDIPMEKENFQTHKKELLKKYIIEEIIIVR